MAWSKAGKGMAILFYGFFSEGGIPINVDSSRECQVSNHGIWGLPLRPALQNTLW